MTFDPDLLPDPVMLDSIRDNAQPPAPQRIRGSDWFTPALLFGAPGTPLLPGVPDPITGVLPIIGVIPVIHDCTPIAWTLSSNVAGFLTLQLNYADYADTPIYLPLCVTNVPVLTGTLRNRYREVPYMSGWTQFLQREGEIQISVVDSSVVEQCQLVLYLQKLRLP